MRIGPLSADQHRLLGHLLGESDDGRPSRIPASEADRGHLPLSAAQRRLWFLDQVQPGSPLYNVVGAAHLHGSLDRAALQRSLDEIVRRHEILRTTFHQDEDEPWARVRPAGPVPLPYHDFSARPGRDAAVATRTAREARRPFDLTTDLMLRTVLLRTGPDDHVLVVCLHHIAADGWSLTLLVRELAVLYGALRTGRAAALPEPGLQYADFAVWEHTRQVEPQLRYWEQRLRGLAPVDLPTDVPRHALASFAGESLPVTVPADLVRRLHELGAAERATPYTVLLAGFVTLLGRWSGQADVVVAASTANRTRVETEQMIGCFVNTLPLRVDLSGRPGFRELVRQVRDGCLADYDNQDAPFDQVVERLRPERERTAHTPLLRHTLVLADPNPSVDLPDLRMEVTPVRTATAKFELRLELCPDRTGALTGVLEYSSEVYSADSVRRLADSFVTVLGAAVREPDRPVTLSSLMGPAEYDRVVHDLSGAGVPAPAPTCLHELFERCVDEAPDRVAVVDGPVRLTYRQLDERANRFAHFLRGRGIGPEQRVAVCLPRSAELVALLLGVLKAGAAFVPLDPDYPQARLAFMVGDSDPTVVLAGSDLPPDQTAPVVLLDDVTAQLATQSSDRPPVATRPGDCAYVVYTSGSTGLPKGVSVDHHALTNLLRWRQATFPLGTDDTALFKGSIGFDVTTGEWAWPLTCGARVVVARPGVERDPAGLAALIRDEHVTTCNFVPSMLRVFLADPAAAGCRQSLRRVLSGGESLTRDLAEQCRAVLPGTQLHNLYGPTEATIDVTTFPADPAGLADHTRVVPLGRPVTGSRLYVLDPELAPVPVGVAGELYVGGVAVALGYHRRPGLTAARFVPDPFTPGRRLYRTGDRVRWLADGALAFLGRLDDQVKIRGQRIEPAETEAVLARHPAVRGAVVTVDRDQDGDTRLTAYLLPHDRVAASLVEEVRAHAREHLPEHMVPAAFVLLAEWPVGPNGKLDRSALPSATPVGDLARPATAPRTPTERRVMDIWLGVLDVEQVGVEDNFFDVGGHSLLAAKLVARIQAAFGVVLSLEGLFGDPTVAGVAAQLDTVRRDEPTAVPITRAARRRHVPG
ncbi:non-ribosomal peptide synthetase [Actinophytocola oryzae]|uniref:Amino acid adenylation domain-containing protein n=1 Tax=Actinophytocola oryzae TaxID=502181 RepID=A0A4V3FRD9_9PSEU|nr:non-ribosomal peptide synthetase [Actinophytocola oryzae]TDV43191.1 amino acid adenylation domain-containing protein [Actinophytocola oryzae]